MKKKPETEPQPHRFVLKRFAISKNVEHSLEPSETPSNSGGISPGSRLCSAFLNIAKHSVKTTKYKLPELESNRRIITGNLIMRNTVNRFRSRSYTGRWTVYAFLKFDHICLDRKAFLRLYSLLYKSHASS